jgi:DNA modification methylase
MIKVIKADVAAKILNRHFIGIEKESKFYEIAKERILAA